MAGFFLSHLTWNRWNVYFWEAKDYSHMQRLLFSWKRSSGSRDLTNLMQLSGSFAQSMLHINLSQWSQPMVGVSAKPLFKASVLKASKTTSPRTSMAAQKHKINFKNTQRLTTKLSNISPRCCYRINGLHPYLFPRLRPIKITRPFLHVNRLSQLKQMFHQTGRSHVSSAPQTRK